MDFVFLHLSEGPRAVLVSSPPADKETGARSFHPATAPSIISLALIAKA